MKMRKENLVAPLLAMLCAGCATVQNHASIVPPHQRDDHLQLRNYQAASGLSIKSRDLDTDKQMIRMAFVSGAPWARPSFCMDLEEAAPNRIHCIFQKKEPSNALSVLRFKLPQSDWSNIMAIVRDNRLLNAPSWTKPVAVGRPYTLSVEFRIGGQFHFIARDYPQGVHEERDMRGLLELCLAVIECSQAPEHDKRTMRELLGSPNVERNGVQSPPADSQPNPAVLVAPP